MHATTRTRRAATAVAAVLVLGAGLLAIGSSAQAKPGTAGRIVGGVEDGTFSRTCLAGQPAPDAGVLQATTYRAALAKTDGIVRILVPWNVAMGSKDAGVLACLRTYLTDSKGIAKVEVSLNRSATAAPGPKPSTYLKAMTKLRKQKLGISYLTAWNEPNNGAYLAGHGAATRAGKYFVRAHQVFGSKVVAGDFASGVSKSFLERYTKALGRLRPKIWAIHPYTDVTNFQYYLSDQPASAKNPAAAAAQADKTSKVAQFARLLARHHYGPRTHIWLNEIYVDHRADKCPPGSHAGSGAFKGMCVTGSGSHQKRITQPGKGKKFSLTNQADAALYLSGGLGAPSLPGMLAGKKVPQLSNYIYLRALDNSAITFKDAVALQVNAKGCVYYTLAGFKTTPAPQCS